MGKSQSFGNQVKPIGKQHRGGTLGEAIDDLRSDIDEAFLTLEGAPLSGLTPQPAYTQTFADADKTHDVDGSTDVTSADAVVMGTVTTAGGNTGTSGAGLSLIGDTSTVDQSAALMNDLLALQEDISDAKTQYDASVTLMNEMKADFNALRATVTDLKELVNSVIDDLQALGLAG